MPSERILNRTLYDDKQLKNIRYSFNEIDDKIYYEKG